MNLMLPSSRIISALWRALIVPSVRTCVAHHLRDSVKGIVNGSKLIQKSLSTVAVKVDNRSGDGLASRCHTMSIPGSNWNLNQLKTLIL